MSSRFVPGDFQYNGPVAFALGPCLAVAAAVGGRPVMATLAIGAMISYMMDTLQYREGAFTCCWLTLVSTYLAFVAAMVMEAESDPLLIMGLCLAMMAVCMVTGMWVSMQFKWIQVQYPTVAVMFERIVITGSVPLAAIMHSMVLALLVDATDIPYFLMASLCATYALLGRPLTSSFCNIKGAAAAAAALGGGRLRGAVAQSGGPAASAAVLATSIQSRFDGLVMAVVTACAPAALYAAEHHSVLFRHALHSYSVVLLLSVPSLFVALVPRGMWWLPAHPRLARALQVAVALAALAGTLVGFEGRVVFVSFRQYVQVPPPWDWITVTAALLGLGAAAAAHVSGVAGRAVDVTLAGTVMLMCTAAGAIAVGIPFQWLPAPLLAAAGLALYYDSGSLREYLLFAGGAAATGVWFVRHHFWFLDIAIGSTHLHLLCQLLLAALVPALMVPGLVASGASRDVLGALLMLQASLLCVLEEKLYAPSHDELAGEVMYPSWLVIATSAAGLATAHWLRSASAISASAAWVLVSLHAAKLCMLILPEAYLVLPSALLALAALAPLFLYQAPRRPHGALGAAAPRRVRIAPWQGLVHALSVLVSVALARFAVFDVVQYVSSSRPSEGTLLGALLLVAAAALSPLVVRCYGSNPVLVRVLALLAMTAALMMFLQPPLPMRGGARCPRLPLSLCPRLWDERHIPMHGVEDVEVWGRGLSRKEHWPRWLLLAACTLGASTATLRSLGVLSMLTRLVLGNAAGLLVGLYLALEVVPQQRALQGMLVAACLALVMFSVLLQLPAARVPGLLPAVFAVWLVLLGLTMLLQTELPPPEVAPEMKRLFPDSTLEVEREIWMATRASLLGVFAVHALFMAFALKLRAAAVLRHTDGRLSDEGHDARLYGRSAAAARYGQQAADLFCGMLPTGTYSRVSGLLQLRGASSAALQRLGRDGLAWAPCIGNVCTLIAFIMAVSLNVYVTGGSPEAIFMLAPMLLLLSQDPLLLPGLEDKQRYFPPVLVTTCYLVLAGVGAVLTAPHVSTGITSWSTFAVTLIYHPLELAFHFQALLVMVLSLPSHILFLRWLWTQKPRPTAGLLVTVGLNMVSLLINLVLGVVEATLVPLYLNGMGCAFGLIQYFAMKHVRQVGVKII